MSRHLTLKLLTLAVLLSGCQQKTASADATPASQANATGVASPAPAAASIKLKVGEKESSFAPASAWLDPRGDTRSGSLTLGNYDFTVTRRSTFSHPDVQQGQLRAIVGLKSPEGAEFHKPVPAGEYTGKSLKSVDIVYFDNGAQQRDNFAEPAGKVVVTESTDTEFVGNVDLTDSKGALLKGEFRAKVATESTADANGAEGSGAADRLPFDYPPVALSAKAGEQVLTPAPGDVYDMLKTGKKSVGAFRPRKLVQPGPELSSVDDNGKSIDLPNALIIALSPGAKVKKGDLVLGYPQYGSMVRAMVTDASNPSQPVVHFFKKVYDKDKAEGEEFTGTLQAGSFRVLEEGVAVGAMVLHPSGEKKGLGQVLNVAGDQVLVSTFGGNLAVFPKGELTAFPLKPKLKAGDRVMAPFASGVNEAVVVRVDDEVGRVLVKFESNPTQGLFSYGEVMPSKS